MTVINTDVLIVGSEGAGARAAIAAHDAGVSVTIVSKGPLGKSGATVTAGADLDLDSKSAKDLLGFPGDPNDSPDIFFEDMIIEGRYINNQKLVEVHVQDAPARIKEMVDWGMKINMLSPASGHRYPRGVWSTGKDMMKTLRNQVYKRKIKVVSDSIITDLLTKDNQVVGATGLDLRTGEFLVFNAKVVILATGGAQAIWPYTTAPYELTGDGQAMALRVGAELVDMEMVQCLPTCFLWPKAWQGIEFPLGFVHYQNVGWLLNKFGERFMKKWDPKREESTTRDVLTVGVMDEILKGNTGPHGGIYLSLAHMPRDLIEYIDVWWGPPKKGPEDRWMMQGISFAELMDKVEQGDSMEVGPAVHFHMGGIKINEKCETNLRGLFAAGECAGGLHGANRLSGNATTQILVQGEVAGRFAAELAKKSQHIEVDESQVENQRKKVFSPLERDEGPNPLDLKKRMHKVAWENVGVLRESWRLKSALEDIEKMRKEVSNIVTTSKDRVYNKEWMVAIQMENMLMVLEVVARSALMRTESRGAHYRKDFPNIDYDNWNKNIVAKQVDSKMELSTNPLAITKFQPPKGVQPYPGD